MHFFGYSISATHHSKIPRLFGTITHFPSLNIFHTILWTPYLLLGAASFFFSFFQYPNSPNPVIKKKKKKANKDQWNKKKKEKKKRTQPRWKKKKRKKEESQWRPVPKEERKVEKKGGKMVKSCGCGSLQVCLFTKMSLSYELWKLKIELQK